MADILPSYIGCSSAISNRKVKQKAESVKPTTVLGDGRKKSGPRTADNCNGLAITAVVSDKKPLAAKTQPIAVKPITAPKGIRPRKNDYKPCLNLAGNNILLKYSFVLRSRDKRNTLGR